MRKYIAIVYSAQDYMSGYKQEYLAYLSDSRIRLEKYIREKYSDRFKSPNPLPLDRFIYEILKNTPNLDEMFSIKSTDIDVI